MSLLQDTPPPVAGRHRLEASDGAVTVFRHSAGAFVTDAVSARSLRRATRRVRLRRFGADLLVGAVTATVVFGLSLVAAWAGVR